MDDVSMVGRDLLLGRRVRRQAGMLRALALTLGVTTALAAGAAPASALEFVADGTFYTVPNDADAIHQQRIAVDDDSGNVLVTDVVADAIDVYDGDGNSLTSFGAGELTDPFGIAVDQRSGAVYISDAGRNRIARYTVVPGPVPVYTLDPTFTGPAAGSGAGEIGDFAAALAIDASSDKLLVADPGSDLVKRYALDGTYDNFSFNGSGSAEGAFTGLLDLAVDNTGDVIVIDSTGDIARGDPATSRVLRFSQDGTFEARIGASLSKPATVTVRPTGGQVLVSANQDAVMYDGRPTVTAFAANGSELAGVDFGSFDADYAVVTGLASAPGGDGRLYVATDVDRSHAFLPDRWGHNALWAFDTIPTTPPVIADQSVQVRPTEATINATIDTRQSQVTYYVEWGLDGAGFTERTSGTSLSPRPTADGVRVRIAGLAPRTSYEYRIVVDYGEGLVDGGDAEFATRPLPATVAVGAVTGLSATAATIHANFDLQGADGSYAFVVEQVGGPFRVDLPRVDVAANGATNGSAQVSGLTAGQTYRVGAAVLTEGGYVTAEPVTFTTPGAPVAPVDPARNTDSGSLYGCQAPRLNAVGRAAGAGQELVLTGSDLGSYGIVTVDGKQAEIRSYASDRVSIVVPEGVRGSVQVTIDCGKTSAAVLVPIAGGGGTPRPVKPTISTVNVRGSVATLRVRVDSPGTLRASGKRLRGASTRASRAGTSILRVRLSPAGRRALAKARRKQLRITISVRFTPAGGSAITTRRDVIFKR